jgi:hypothetical protein
MTSPERTPADPSQRLYRQLRHDVDDVYDLLGDVDRKVTTLAATQKQHSRRLEEVQRTLDRHETRFDEVGRRFDGLDRRFEAVDARFDGVDARFDGVDARFDAVGTRFDAVDGAQLAEILQILRAGRPTD